MRFGIFQSSEKHSFGVQRSPLRTTFMRKSYWQCIVKGSMCMIVVLLACRYVSLSSCPSHPALLSLLLLLLFLPCYYLSILLSLSCYNPHSNHLPSPPSLFIFLMTTTPTLIHSFASHNKRSVRGAMVKL